MNNSYLSLLIITRAAQVYQVLILFNVRVSDSFILIDENNDKEHGQNKRSFFRAKVYCYDVKYTFKPVQIQVQTCFRLLEINFLISIILGMSFFTRNKTILAIEREIIFNWTSLKQILLPEHIFVHLSRLYFLMQFIDFK